jgi:hypothetical protein
LSNHATKKHLDYRGAFRHVRYEIAYQGVAAVEAEEISGQPPAIYPLLAAPGRPAN